MTTVGTDLKTVTMALDYSGPFDTASLLDFLRRRAVAGIESVGATRYARTLRLPHGPAVIDVRLDEDRVDATFRHSDPRDLPAAVQRCRDLLDLDSDLSEIDPQLAMDPMLAASVRAHPGLRVPGHVDGFEVAVRAIVGQQISVAGARTILGRLVAEHGIPFSAGVGLTALFPTADALAGVDPERLSMPAARGRALTTLARAVAGGAIALDRSADPADVRRSLLALPGIGPWTADYIALRALGDRDVFLGTDLGVRQALSRLASPADDRPAPVPDRWRPWRSYALMHVWKSLDEAAR